MENLLLVMSIYRDGETKAAASTTFSGDEILSMSLEDYTLTLTVEDISKFQTPAKNLSGKILPKLK